MHLKVVCHRDKTKEGKNQKEIENHTDRHNAHTLKSFHFSQICFFKQVRQNSLNNEFFMNSRKKRK